MAKEHQCLWIVHTMVAPVTFLHHFAENVTMGNTASKLPSGITNTKGWSDEQIADLLIKTKAQIGWNDTTGSARRWWEAFENENASRNNLVLRLAEEIKLLGATITEFFLAYVYSNTDNIQANLHYLQFSRIRRPLVQAGVLLQPRHAIGVATSKRSDFLASEFDKSRARSKFLLGCLEEEFAADPRELEALLTRIGNGPGTLLDRFFSGAALSHLIEPNAVVHYLGYQSLRIAECIKRNPSDEWKKDFYLSDSDFGEQSLPPESAKALTWIKSQARRALLTKLAENYPDVADEYSDDDSCAIIQSIEESASTLDEALALVNLAIGSYHGEVFGWQDFLAKAVFEFVVPFLDQGDLRSGIESPGFQKVLESLPKVQFNSSKGLSWPDSLKEFLAPKDTPSSTD